MKPVASSSSVSAWLAARANGVAFVSGLILFGVGLSLAWAPLGLIGVGAVLMAVSVLEGNRA